MKISEFVNALKNGKEPETNERGNLLFRSWASTERYAVDFARDFQAERWMQYDTDQDAWYFGVWVNPQKLLTLTYADGDWTLVVCPDAAHYNAEIADANRFYGEGFIAKSIDLEGCMTVHRQDRSQFFIP